MLALAGSKEVLNDACFACGVKDKITTAQYDDVKKHLEGMVKQ